VCLEKNKNKENSANYRFVVVASNNSYMGTSMGKGKSSENFILDSYDGNPLDIFCCSFSFYLG